MKKQPTKRKRKKKSNNIAFKYLTYLLLFCLLTLAVFAVGYYIGYKDGSFDQINKQKLYRLASKPLKHVTKPSLPKKIKQIPVLSHQATMRNIKHKPKLAIIFDDVSFASEVRDINALHLKVTMSFFPPNYIHPNTALLAAKEPFYMVHLPLQAIEFKHPEPNTLNITDSLAKIQKRIATIKKEFPRLSYLNNHTGSTFTANLKAMQKLIYVLKKYHIQFVDSVTTPHSKAPEVTKEFHMRYIARDVFLDDKQNVAYIKHQLKIAVDIAKKKGYAIAIGHPHPATLKAVGQSKQLLKQVDLVYVDQI